MTMRVSNQFAATRCLWVLMVGAGFSILKADESKVWSDSELRHATNQVEALGDLTNPPVMRNEAGQAIQVSPGEMQKIYYDALPYRGMQTRAFALVKIPDRAAATETVPDKVPGKMPDKVPGIVLVHGGGGSAFSEWVDLWVNHGYAAISIAVEGQTDEREQNASGRQRWVRHAWAGPQRDGIYGDSAFSIEDQWMYHAVADTVLANSLLRSLPEVDSDRVGVMGISWGGVITSTVVGIDDRFAFAIPVYGCGHKFDSQNQYGKALGESDLYKKVWDPVVRLDRARMPIQWLSWPGDKHFPMDALAACYRRASGPRLVTLIPGMKHGHRAAWLQPDSFAFADSIVRSNTIWSRQTGSKRHGDRYVAKFKTTRPVERAVLISTADTGFTGSRRWTQTAAEHHHVDGEWIVTATLPPETTAWFVNLKSGKLTVSSDYEQL